MPPAGSEVQALETVRAVTVTVVVAELGRRERRLGLCWTPVPTMNRRNRLRSLRTKIVLAAVGHGGFA